MLLDWNRILFMKYFYLIQNIAEQNVISERLHARRSLCVLILHSPFLTSSVFDSLSFEGFQVAQQCHLLLPRQEKTRQGPSGTEGALLLG